MSTWTLPIHTAILKKGVVRYDTVGSAGFRRASMIQRSQRAWTGPSKACLSSPLARLQVPLPISPSPTAIRLFSVPCPFAFVCGLMAAGQLAPPVSACLPFPVPSLCAAPFAHLTPDDAPRRCDALRLQFTANHARCALAESRECMSLRRAVRTLCTPGSSMTTVHVPTSADSGAAPTRERVDCEPAHSRALPTPPQVVATRQRSPA